MLTIFRRHVKKCAHRSEGRNYRRCHCPIWVDGSLGTEEIRQVLRDPRDHSGRETVRDWQKAQDIVREWEAENKQTPPTQEPTSVEGAWEQFLRDAKARNLRESTLKKYGYLRKQMEAFAQGQGIRYVREFDLGTLHAFRASWSNQNLSALKKLELLRCFFRFVHDSGWIESNPARKVKNPKVTPCPTLPFSREEMVKICSAFDAYAEPTSRNGRQMRALVLLLRYTGLRISDAVMLSRDRIKEDKLFLYTSKTGTPVHSPLPTIVTQALDLVPLSGPYYFWTGKSKPKTAISHWQAELQKLFTKAEVEHGHAHRFRHSWAIDLLLQGVPLERVSILLGHSSIRVTEKHYSPWIRSRQEQLEADVRRTWANDLLIAESGTETKGTREVHGKPGHVN